MCPGWAKDGQCVHGTANYNPWMLRNCQKSCMEAGDNFPTAGPNGGPQPTTATDDAPTFSPTTPLPTGFPSTPVPSPGPTQVEPTPVPGTPAPTTGSTTVPTFSPTT